MVKLRVTFGENATLIEIKLVDEKNLADWTVTLLPLNQDIKFDLSVLTLQLQECVQGFSHENVIWTFYENLVPYVILTPIPKTAEGMTYKRELSIVDGKTDIVIFDITRHQLDLITHKRGLKSQQERFLRHVATIYHTFRLRLVDLYWKRLVLHNQREQLKAQKLQTETIDGLAAQIIELRMTMMAKSPSAVVAPPSTNRTSLWGEWDNENDEKAFMADTRQTLTRDAIHNLSNEPSRSQSQLQPTQCSQSPHGARPLGPHIVSPTHPRKMQTNHVGDQSYHSLASCTPLVVSPPPILVCASVASDVSNTDTLPPAPFQSLYSSRPDQYD